MTSSLSSGAESDPAGRITAFLRLIRFSHTLFALPFAIAGFALGAREAPGPPGEVVRIATFALAAIVCARTAAMAFNRLVDRRFDATNPRTRARASVTGEIGPRQMVAAVALSAAGFVLAAALLNPICGALALPTLLLVLGYSYTKRVTSLSHFVLGAALGLAPLGAYLAVTAGFGPATPGMVLLAAAVLFWTAGFDILYACQDVEHDRATGLFSIPARLGVGRALVVARSCHALVLVLLLLAARALGLGIVFSMGVVVTGLLLAIEHRLVTADDLSSVPTAFFRVNVLVSVVVMTAVVADLWTR
jgi:4-hydroxybenzoate polyprenyltransferase